MTSYLAYQLMTSLQLSLETQLSVPQFCTWALGTSAGLLPNEIVTLKDLFYGLMLPSGNDAALALAWFFGQKLLIEDAGQHKNKTMELKDATGWKKVTRFVKEMNKTANKLLLKNTQFNNPNGLGDKSNRSTAEDITKIATISIQIPFIKELVSTKMYTTILLRKDIERTVTWLNTNLLLDTDGFIGMKTGVTPTAGPCLTIIYAKDGIEVVLTLLNSKNLDHRWEEAKRLISWAVQKIQNINFKQRKNKLSAGRFRMNFAYLQNEEIQVTSSK